jgi:hypothetical protein
MLDAATHTDHGVCVPSCSSPAAALGAVDLLAVASRAAAAVACEQTEAVAAAARVLQSVIRDQGLVWVVGAAADDHARRLQAAGQRAAACTDIERLPQRLGSLDALLLSLVDEAPRALLAEARRRRIDTIVLTGPGGIDHDGEAIVRVRCYDTRALELAHGFIVMALCAESAELCRAQSAA